MYGTLDELISWMSYWFFFQNDYDYYYYA